MPRYAQVVFPILASKCHATLATRQHVVAFHTPQHDFKELLHPKRAALQRSLAKRSAHFNRWDNCHDDPKSTKSQA